MKKLTKIILGSVTAIAIAVGASGYAMARQHGGHGMMGEYMVYKLEKKLALNETQVAELKSIQAYMQEKRKAHSPEDHKAKIKALLEQPVLDQGAAMAMVEEKMQEMRSNAPEMIGKIAAFTDSLTTEQRAELLTMMDKFGHGRHHRGGDDD